MREHPKYPGVMIYEGPKGEEPKPGAFYQPKKGDILSRIGSRAGVPWRKINYHPWNINNLLEYRASSSSCKSKKLTGAARKRGFISLCPSVGHGRFQIIWIPPKSGDSPQDFTSEEKPRIKSGLLRTPSRIKVPKAPDNGAEIKTQLLNTGTSAQRSMPRFVAEEAPDEDGVPLWAIAVGSAGALGMIWLIARK